MTPQGLYGKTPAEVSALLEPLRVPAYRPRQICRWMYRRGATSFEEMTDLSREFRAELGARFHLGRPAIAAVRAARDGTRKYAIALADGSTVESVLIAGGRRPTICLSSQVGCAMQCTFCRTGDMGLKRHMTHEEIVAQVGLVRAEASLGEDPCNFVFMGMGEPLHNVTEVVSALRVMTDADGFGISPRRITVSTVGYLAGLPELEASGIKVKLALSLSAPRDEMRDGLVPANRRYPMAQALEAARAMGRRRGVRLTVAYVLLAGVNDAPADARALSDRLAAFPVKVNLIPFNPYDGSPYRRPADGTVDAFRDVLLARGIHATVRHTHGEDVLAACGQLATAVP